MATTKRESPGKDIKSLPRITTTPSFIPILSKRPPPKEPTPTTTKLPSSHKNVRNRLTKPSQVPSPAASRLVRKVQRISPVVVKKPALSARTSMHRHSKASIKSNAPSQPVRTVQRGVTPHKKVNDKALAPPLKKTSIDLTPFAEVELGDRYVLHDEVEEIANIGSDDDLVPFDQMEFPEMNAPIVVDHDPAILVSSEVTLNEETENHLVEEEVRVSNQRSEDGSVGTSDQESKKEESIASTQDEVEVVEEKEEAVAAPRPKAEKRKQQQGKKETAVVYNDVIEETASKLLEKRKNKVRALVGAFETVISLQE